jgi:small subunit ribosomal protein S1
MTMTEKDSDLEPSTAETNETPSDIAGDGESIPEAPSVEPEPAHTEQQATQSETPTASEAGEADEIGGSEEPTEDEPAIAPTTGDGRSPRSRMSRGRQMRLASLYRSFRSGRPIEGMIDGVIKGGYEVRLGKIRGFCPHSQIALERIQKPEDHVGQKYLFRITQLRRGGDDIVVSRRAVLEDERQEEASAVRATLIEGAVMRGHVAGLAEFGAFVDLGAGVMGLVHVSELSHTRITRVSDAVKVGDAVSVKILKLDEKNKRVSLSIRQAQADPWAGVDERFEVGKVYPGSVERLTDFGAFVELEPAVEALAPASEFPPSKQGWRDGLDKGQTRDWLVLSVDAAQHRISVTPPDKEISLDGLPPLEVGANLRGRVQRVEKFGVFVWLGPGRIGLMPNVWTGTQRGEDVSRRFPIDDEIEVVVVEVGDGGRRIRLAKQGVAIEEPAARPKPRRQKPDRQRGAGRPHAGADRAAGTGGDGTFGTILADKLRAALGKPGDES